MKKRTNSVVKRIPYLATLLCAVTVAAAAGPGFDPTPIQLPTLTKASKRPITSMDLLLLRDPHGLKISPDGKFVACVVGQAVYETNSYRSTLFVIGTAAGSMPINLGSAGAPEWTLSGEWQPATIEWSPDSRYIAVLADRNGTRQVWRWRREGGGGDPVQLTHSRYDIKSFHWSSDARTISYVIEKVAPTLSTLDLQKHGILYDERFRSWRPLAIVTQSMEFTPHTTEEWICYIASGQERIELGDKVYEHREALIGKRGRIVEPKASPDGKNIVYQVWNTPKGAQLSLASSLYIMSVDTGVETLLRASAYYLSDYQWSADSSTIFYTESAGDGHSPQLFAVSKSGGPPRNLSQASSLASLDEFSVDDAGDYAACAYSSTTTPAEIALLDLRSGLVRILINLNPELENLELSSATRFEWTNQYGDRQHAYLVLPPNHKPGHRYPLVVTTYRSGDYFLRGGTGDEYPIQVFASNGFAVLAFDIGPGDIEFKADDFESTMARWRSPLSGLEVALDLVDKTGTIDPTRRSITGLSFGAEIAEFVLTHSDLFQAGISSGGGVLDPSFYYMAGKDLHRMYSQWGLPGLPDGSSARHWSEMSPSLNAERISGPLLINVSESEFLSSLQFITTLSQLGKTHEVFIYPDELHVKNQPMHRYEIYERNLDWFKFWLEGKEDTDPAKQPQYQRWRQLSHLK